jgi:hypothetical protein
MIPARKGHWNIGWTKSGAIVPEKIAGKYWMYFLGTSPDKNDQTGLASSTESLALDRSDRRAGADCAAGQI